MELGYYEGCQQELAGVADFVVLNTNITHLIGMARMGLCLPKGCHQKHYDAFTTTTVGIVNGFLDYLDKENNYPQLHGAFVRNWTRVGLTLTKSDEYTTNWVGRTAPGVAPTTVAIVTIVCLAMVANVVMYCRHKKSLIQSQKFYDEVPLAS